MLLRWRNMKWINVSRWGIAGLAVLLGAVLSGCGGGGGGDDSNNSGGNQNQTPAPEIIGGNSITFYSGTEGNRAIAFQPDNATWTENRDGNNFGGTYQYSRAESPGSASLVLNEAGQESRITLTFNSATSGSYVYRDTNASGTFEMQSMNPNPGGGNEPPTNDGLAPGSLAGKTMYGTRTFTSTGPVGQTHVYTFSMSTFHDSDPPEESDGSYLYEPNGNNANLTLSYHAPAGFNGDRHELNMTFHTATAGAFESVYTRRDGTVIRINGTFTIE